MSALQNMDLSNLSIDLFTPYYCDNQDYIKYVNSLGGKIIHMDLPFKVGGTRCEIVPCFKEFLQANYYDVVHIHSGSISVLAYYAQVASEQGVKKVIVHSHSSGVKENVKHFLIKLYASRLFKKYATDFCACSMEAAKWKFPKSVLSRTNIMNNGVDLEKYKFNSSDRIIYRKKFDIDNDELVLGHVGRFSYEKNQAFLIELLKEYVHKNPKSKVKLFLIGDGAEFENVKQKAMEFGISSYINFVGVSDNVVDFLQVMDIFLFPSLYEGLGIVGIEAQAAGLPVIASKGIPKTIKVTENVHFVSLNDINQWCNKIDELKLIKRGNHSEDIKKNGFDILDTANEIRKLYF